VRVCFEDGKKQSGFAGPVNIVTFGSEQYVWINDGLNSHADPDNPPAGSVLNANSQTVYTLPRASITVLRGKRQ
jgi:hypothetical protein